MGDLANIVCLSALALFGYLVAPERMRPPHIVYHGDVKFLVHQHTILGATHSHNPHDLHFSGWAVQAAASYLRPGSKAAFVAGVGAGSVVKELRHRHAPRGRVPSAPASEPGPRRRRRGGRDRARARGLARLGVGRRLRRFGAREHLALHAHGDHAPRQGLLPQRDDGPAGHRGAGRGRGGGGRPERRGL
mmetsp:Transcript_5608/g.16534  ORF Transcript_5608/g.16534 Transcript_5608/m.16534 type:complete len:190 (+) Transcript_5608:335-904(+)